MNYSLEKTMLFIPNRFFVRQNDMFVSFNIAGIPPDMVVTSMILHVPVPARSHEMHLQAYEITTAWDEQSIQTVQPSHALTNQTIYISQKAKEGTFTLNHLAHPWRFQSLDNHGVYIQSLLPISFSEEHPPYLIINSI